MLPPTECPWNYHTIESSKCYALFWVFTVVSSLTLLSWFGCGVTGVWAMSTVSPRLSQNGARRSIKMAPNGAVKIMARTEMMSTLLANVKSLATLALRAKSNATGPRAACLLAKRNENKNVMLRFVLWLCCIILRG